MKLRIFIFLLCTISFLTACNGNKGIYGIVIDGEAGKPLAGAIVELTRCETILSCDMVASLTTGSDGRYSFADIPAGKYDLIITWENAPNCPGIQPNQCSDHSGEFWVSYYGYCVGLLYYAGVHNMVAGKSFELQDGDSVELNLTFACPK